MPEEKLSGLTSAMPVIGAGIDFGSDLLGMFFNSNQAKKNRAFQERMYNRQYQDSIKFWQMQQDWNSPSAQLARLREAGLNPLLMYSNGASGLVAASPAQLPSAPSGGQASYNGKTGFGQALTQAALMNAQLRMMNAESESKEAAAEKSRSETHGQDFLNWLNDNSKSVQLALKFRDYDYVNSVIDKNRNEVFQSSFRNAAEMGSLSLLNSLAIRRQNLSEYEVGENIKMGWRKVVQGDISASAQLKQAFAAMMQATTAAKISNAQIGLMRAQAANWNEQTRFLKGSYDFRIKAAFAESKIMGKQLSWYDVLNEAGVSKTQSETFLNKMQHELMFNQNEWLPIDKLMTPVNMLTGFGAGLLINGNIGRVKINGFQ